MNKVEQKIAERNKLINDLLNNNGQDRDSSKVSNKNSTTVIWSGMLQETSKR